jgi:L-alanine-DL-glutamate epimerase-like enolase superfamily enzyme
MARSTRSFASLAFDPAIGHVGRAVAFPPTVEQHRSHTMNPTRRQFLQKTTGAGLLAGAVRQGMAGEDRSDTISGEELVRVAEAPVLQVNELSAPVTIAEMELLRNRRNLLVRVRTRDGAEGLAVPNSMHLVHTYPIFLNRVAPFFIGKDARGLEPLLWELYRHDDNYKYQGLALWVCVAAAEFAILDLLGKLTGKAVGDLLGGVRRRDIAVYRASGTRGNTPEEEIADLKRIVAESGAKALKFRVGGRMSRNADSLPGRTERLIPLVRETFGPGMTIYADSNSSYDVPEAIRVGRLMEKYDYSFFEEPCRFDHLEETKAVADALSIPIAGGEQEFSEYGFRWMIAHRAVDVVQPDLHYHGGFIRSLRVARMAHAAGLLCTPHMSGSGLGYLDAAHFVSCIDNPVPFTEFKGDTDIPVSSPTSSLKCEKGVVRVPSGPGFGIMIDPGFVHEAKRVTTF